MSLNFSNYKPGPTISLIGVTWTLSSWLLSKLWGYGWLQGIGPTVIVGLLLFAYDRWAWRWPGFSLLNTVPDLSGLYRGEIVYAWNGEEGRKPCEMSVRQRCSHIKVTSVFGSDEDGQTRSISTHAMIEEDASGEHKLIFLYHNDGSHMTGNSITCHDGTNILNVVKNDGLLHLIGHYYTNREPQTKGRIKLKREAIA